MERPQKEGGDRVIQWFADLGDPSTWSKHKFDPNVCNDSNTSNFVESFNSTLGVDRYRPVLTLLEGMIYTFLLSFFIIIHTFCNLCIIYFLYRNKESLYGEDGN